MSVCQDVFDGSAVFLKPRDSRSFVVWLGLESFHLNVLFFCRQFLQDSVCRFAIDQDLLRCVLVWFGRCGGSDRGGR